MGRFIKFILLVSIIIFALINYRIFSFDKGFSITDSEKNVTNTINTLTGIQKVEYYKKTLNNDEYSYKVYILTNEDAYLLDATEDDIEAFSFLGIFSNNLQPQKVQPIPFYIEIIVGIVILLIPVRTRKNN